MPDSLAIAGAGTLITGLSLGFAAWARKHLGGYWSARVTLKENHKLIQTGPYKYVRHPIYTGMIFAVVGTAITVGKWRGVLALVILTLACVRKLLIEEKYLLGHLGKEYKDYRQGTRALVPFIV